MNLKILVCFAIILFTIFVIWKANRRHVPAKAPSPGPTFPLSIPAPPTTGSGANPPAQAGGWKKLGWLVFTVAIISGGIIGIYWGVQKIDHGMPEKKEFTAYYQYEEDGEDGGQVLVRITPNTVNFGFPSKRFGGNVSMRWSRGGDGVWTRVSSGSNFTGSWLHIVASGDPEADYKEWQHLIIGKIGDDTDPYKSNKISLTR